MKTCRNCGETKPKSSFYSHPRTLDGLLHECKACKVVTNARRAAVGPRPCSFEGCAGHSNHGRSSYCTAHDYAHDRAVSRLGARQARIAWSSQLRSGIEAFNIVRPQRPAGLYGLIVPLPDGRTIGKFGKTTCRYESRWSGYDVPFIPWYVTDYDVDNHDREMVLRRMVREMGTLVQGHEWVNLSGLADTYKWLADQEDLAVITKLWTPATGGLVPCS